MSKNFDFDEDFMDVPVDEKGGEVSNRIRKADKKKKSNKGKAAVGLVLAVLVVIGGVVGVKYYSNHGGQIPFLNKAEETQAETEEATEPQTEAPAEVQVTLAKDSDADLLTLVKNYYAARVSGDADTLATILADGSTLNTDELASEKEFIEDYTDIATYVTDGMKDGEQAVYISYNLKFKNINTPAPGLEPAYVTVDESGSKRLMFYNDFNNDVKTYMNSVSASTSVVYLSTKVREAYQSAQDSDADLKAFLTALAGEAQAEESSAAESSAAEESPAAESTAAESSAAAEETTTAAATSAADEGTFSEMDDMQYTNKDGVNFRKSPDSSNSDDVIKSLPKGSRVHVIGTRGEWSKVQFDGETGYISSQFLSQDNPNE